MQSFVYIFPLRYHFCFFNFVLNLTMSCLIRRNDSNRLYADTTCSPINFSDFGGSPGILKRVILRSQCSREPLWKLLAFCKFILLREHVAVNSAATPPCTPVKIRLSFGPSRDLFPLLSVFFFLLIALHKRRRAGRGREGVMGVSEKPRKISTAASFCNW